MLKNQRAATAEEVKQFTFDAVFDVASTQEQVFATVAQPIIDSTMNGYNGTIFAYGQTGTGKVRKQRASFRPILCSIEECAVRRAECLV